MPPMRNRCPLLPMSTMPLLNLSRIRSFDAAGLASAGLTGLPKKGILKPWMWLGNRLSSCGIARASCAPFPTAAATVVRACWRVLATALASGAHSTPGLTSWTEAWRVRRTWKTLQILTAQRMVLLPTGPKSALASPLCLDHDTPNLDETLGDFAALHAPWPIEALVTTRRRSQVVDCNWKAFLEVFNEYYHLPFVHRDSINDVYKTPESGDVVTGAYASQFGSTEGTGSQLQGAQMPPLPMMPGMKGREAAGVRYTWVFPNMAFAAYVDAFWIYEAYPMGPNQCLVFQTACFPAETIARPEFQAQLAAFYHRLDAALAEDVPALINQHRGLSSPDARPGRFQPRLEPNVAAFANWYAGKILAEGR